MKLMNNAERLNAGGDEIITIEITKSASEAECDDITKLRKKEYHRKYHAKYYQKHKKQYLLRIKAYTLNNKELVKQRQHKWYIENKQYALGQSQKYKAQHKDDVCRSRKIYKLKNAAKIKQYNIDNAEHIRKYKNLYVRRKLKSDTEFKLMFSCRKRIRGFLQSRGIKKNKRTHEILGCSWNALKLHLEAQFKDGMTWENHGIRGWHIDHIIPLASAKSDMDIYKLCHYTNLQPLWWKENLRKTKNICYERIQN
jgi:hypothetical protein